MSQSFHERRGAHRPPGLGPAGAIPWLVAAVVIVLVVGYATGWWGNSGEDSSTSASSDGPVSTSTTKAGGTATKSTKPTSSSSPTSATSTAPTATVDHSQQVTVLNGTKRSGLAAGAASKLRGAGWTIRSTGNYSAGVPATTVFYGRSSLSATAKAIAQDLGGATTQESADFGPTRVTVVLASDFQG